MSQPHLSVRRSGNVSVYLMAFMIVTVPAMLMALNVWRIVEGRVQQQRFCDAAVHAAACELTRETTTGSIYSLLLYGDPADILSLCQTNAIAEAQNYAAKNYVDGDALALDVSTPQKDVKFGSYDFNAAAPAFAEIDPTTADTLSKRSINAVRVEGHRTVARSNSVRLFGPAWIGFTDAQIISQTTAALDRRVVGFRIQSNLVSATYQTIPLAPVALLSRSVDSPLPMPPTDSLTWEYQVENAANPADPLQIPISYGTMIVNLPTSANGALAGLNSQLLKIGTADVAALNDQLISGVTAAQMTTHKLTETELILDATAKTVDVPLMAAPTPTMSPPDGTNPTTDFEKMYAKFLKLQSDGTERAWPLYKTVSGGKVVVNGFVAARVITVSTPMDGGNYYISLELKPTLLETPTAFTDYSNRFVKTPTSAIPNSGPPSPYAGYSRLVNPYICRVRLVD